jgi:carboxyl-terminal processing protease
MYLKPRPTPVADTNTYDRAGLWLNVEGNGFKIASVTKGAPAEEAGLVKDDIITAVDGKPAAAVKLPDLRKMLRTAKPGTVVTFTVTRGGAPKDIKVSLRDLI